MSAWTELGDIWQACFAEAAEAYLHHASNPIGAVVVDGEGKIISRGRNDWSNRLRHAETDALWNLPRDTNRVESEIYSSLEPCPMCTGAIRMTQLRAVHFAAVDPSAGSTDFLSANEFMQRFPCEVYKPADRTLEFVLVTLILELRTRMGQKRWRELWFKYQPEATELGEKLAASKAFDHWTTSNITASELYEEISELALRPI